ncbi:MAG: thiol:disulfide interchange protein DsbA/DsbL [Cocleimonas sp.]
MKKLQKLTFLAVTSLFLVTACDTASSDAKKVDVKKVDIKKVVKETTEVVKKEAASSASKFKEGKHYVEIFPEMQTDSAMGKVEVVELMWLGCPHCYTLEPIMLAYKKNHPDFVEFKQVPAMLNPSWAADAKTYYIAEILDPTGEKDLVTKIFKSIHEQKRRLRTPDAAKRFFVQQGYTEEQVINSANSMAFQAKIKRAQEIGESSQAQSVPTVIINGKYRTSPYMAGSNEDLMKIVDMLTKQEKK